LRTVARRRIDAATSVSPISRASARPTVRDRWPSPVLVMDSAPDKPSAMSNARCRRFDAINRAAPPLYSPWFEMMQTVTSGTVRIILIPYTVCVCPYLSGWKNRTVSNRSQYNLCNKSLAADKAQISFAQPCWRVPVGRAPFWRILRSHAWRAARTPSAWEAPTAWPWAGPKRRRPRPRKALLDPQRLPQQAFDA